MTRVLVEHVTLERHRLTLRAVKLLGRWVTPGEVVKVLELAADDGLWPVPDPTCLGAGYYSRTRPYVGGTQQHMEQMTWRKPPWLQYDRTERLFGLTRDAAGVEPLDKKYLRLVGEASRKRPEPRWDEGEVAKRCVVCRRPFRSRLWTCGDTACEQLVAVPREIMARRERLQSEGLSVVFDADLRSQMRFVLVTTARGTWKTNALKWETWEQLLERACG